MDLCAVGTQYGLKCIVPTARYLCPDLFFYQPVCRQAGILPLRSKRIITPPTGSFITLHLKMNKDVQMKGLRRNDDAQ
jgi:hypothetical protein